MDGDEDAIQVTTHPPERGVSKSITLACGCSCCCCCCLHTVGSLALAGVGTRTPSALRASKTAEQNESRSTAKKLYWLSLLFVSCLIPGGIFAVETPHDAEDFLLIVAVVVLLALPLCQLGASFVTLILLKLAPESVIPAKGEAHRALARITIFSLLGAVLGFLLLIPLFALALR